MNTESYAQQQYYIKHRRHHNTITFLRIFLLIAFLILWETASRLHWIDSFFFSSPSMVAVYFLKMLKDGSFFVHTGITLFETLVSFALICILGIFSATLLWYYHPVAEVTEPYFVVLNSLPKSALAPLLIVWLGTGMNTIIIAGISVALFGSVINLYTCFKQVDEERCRLIYTLGGTRFDVYKKVILPSSVPGIISNMKVNVGLALVGVIIGEFLAARRGLCYLIIYGSQVFQLNMVITSILILCFLALLLYQLLQHLEHRNKKKNAIS